MKVKSINKFNTILPKKGAFTIETDKDFPKLHTLTIASGKRGGGKSVAISNILREARNKNYFDRILLISPTYNSNKQIWDICYIQEEDVYEPNVNVLKDIISFVEAEKQEYDDFIVKKERYKTFQKDIKHKPISAFDPEELIGYLEMGFLDQNIKPEWKYQREQPPRIGLVIDDCMGTDLMSKRTAGLTNLCIKHRHISDGLGISIFMLVQSYCANGGVARPIRENCTNILLFKINDENQIKKLKDEADLPITDQEFNEMVRKVHEVPYNYLFIDFSPKCETKRFRNAFNEYLIPESLQDKCTCKK